MNFQLHAGYVFPGVLSALVDSQMVTEETLRPLLRGWTRFDVECAADLTRRPADDPVLLTAANIVARGLPTLPGVEMQQHADRCFGRTETRVDESRRIVSHSRGLTPTHAETLLDMLRAVDPRVEEDAVLQRFAASKSAGLIKLLLPSLRELFGSAVSHLLMTDEERPALLLPFPEPLNGIRGLRAFAVKKNSAGAAGVQQDGWYDMPIADTSANAVHTGLQALRTALPREALPFVVQDARMLRPENIELLQLLLAPLAAARLQAVFLALLLRGQLDFKAETLRLLVVERDVPAAALAFADLEHLLTALLALEGKGRKAPALEITVHSGGAFAASKLHTVRPVTMLRKGAAFPETDCLIDLSMLLRTDLPVEAVTHDAPVSAVIRSARDARQERRMQYGKPVRWKPAIDGAANRADSARSAAQQHLLRRLFRFAELPAQRQSLLDRLLAQDSLVAGLPADSGKTLLAHMAGLLQPAPTMVLSLQSLHALDQGDMLREHMIDAYTVLHDGLGREERNAALRAFAARETLFCHAPASLVLQEEVAAAVESMGAEGVSFAQCVIDDAQGLSEWSEDFRPAYAVSVAFAAHTLPAGKDVRTAIRLLTSSAAFEILADLRRQLAQAGKTHAAARTHVLREERVLGDAVRYYVLPITGDAQGKKDAAAARKHALRSFIPRLPAFFAELQESVPKAHRLPDTLLRNFFHPSARQGGIVFCAEAAGPLGVSGRFSPAEAENGIAEALAGVEGVRAGVCTGDDNTQTGRRALQISDEDRRRYRRGAINLLVAAHAGGIGAAHGATRYVLHAIMPTGLERFVRESARAGKDGALALAAILYDGDAEAAGEDLRQAERQLRNTAADPVKEKQIIHDLLREISFPEDSNTGRIANLIADEYGIELRVSYWQRGLDERMYLQEDGRNYGYVDLVTQEIVPDEGHPAPALARELLEYAHRHSLEAAGSGPSLSSWVAATFPSDIDDGITRQMQDFDSGATFTLRLGFENDRETLLNKIHHLLWHEAEVQIQRKLLSEISAPTWQEFCQQLEERSGRTGALSTIDEAIRDRILHFFNRLRTREDTERIIYRLAALGAVDACTVSQAARKFSLTMNVRSESEYRDALERCMRVYLPAAQVGRELDALSSYPGDSMLERCLYFHVDFSARNVQRQHAVRVREMDTACRIGSAEGPDAFRAYIDLTLRAKYARSDALPAALQALPLDRFALCHRYMTLLEEDESGSVLGNAQHLRDSTGELLRHYEDEPALAALNVFARMLLTAEESEAEALPSRFVQHVTRCAAAQQIRGAEYLEAIAPWMQVFRRYLSQERTQKLREALEAAADRIPHDAPENRPTGKAAPEPKKRELPDITAARAPAPQDSPGGSVPVKPRKSGEDDPRAVRAGERASTGATAGTAEENADTGRRIEQKSVTASPEASTASEEDLLREMEKELDAGKEAEARKRRPDGETTQPNTVAKTGTGRADRSSTDADIDSLLAEIENTLTPAAPPPQQRAAVKTPPAAEADPAVTTHLQWLKSFNATFLNAYESRNARLTAGTRKRA